MGKGWLSRPQHHFYQHHHFWALRMLYLSITIATQTTSPRTVGFILWRRKFGRELMAMKSPDYHTPHRQAHPGGCGSSPSPGRLCTVPCPGIARDDESRNQAAEEALPPNTGSDRNSAFLPVTLGKLPRKECFLQETQSLRSVTVQTDCRVSAEAAPPPPALPAPPHQT